MLSAGALVLASGLSMGAVPATPSTLLPDDADLFRGTPGKPDVEIIIDNSCSMNDGPLPTACIDFVNRYTSADYAGENEEETCQGTTCLDKMRQVKAILTGCNSDSDGVLDRWGTRVNFQVRRFSTDTTVPTNGAWTKTIPQKEGEVLTLADNGSTWIATTIKKSAIGFRDYFKTSPANTKLCRNKFVIFMTDGKPNEAPDECFLAGYTDSDGDGKSNECSRYNHACDSSQLDFDNNAPWNGTQYNKTKQILCNVLPTKPSLPTYTIGVGKPGTDYDTSTLKQMANLGGGQFFPGGTEAELDAAFESILSSIQTQSAVFFSAPGQTQDGLFTGNRTYVAAFAPRPFGRWRGNLKAHCIFPPILSTGKYDTTDTTCMFKSPNGKDLYTNPAAKDQWNPAATPTTATDALGAGLIRKNSLGSTVVTTKFYGTDSACRSDTTCNKPRIYTWRSGVEGYLPVNPTYQSGWADFSSPYNVAFGPDDAWMVGGAYVSMINYLHGYKAIQAPDNVGALKGGPVQDIDGDSATGPSGYEFLNVDDWSLGDPMHAPTAVVQYGTSDQCSTTAGKCFVFMAANDGMLHVFDTFDGRETSALVPSELWDVNEAVRFRLQEIAKQPTVANSHKYYVDGSVMLIHDDRNGNGIVDVNAITNPDESANLFFSLGRGGRAMYKIKLDTFTGEFQPGASNKDKNPIYPVFFDASVTNAWSELQYVLANPWAGQMLYDSSDADTYGEPHNVMIFGSGHIPEFDDPTKEIPRDAPGPVRTLSTSLTCAQSIGTVVGGANDCSKTNTAGRLSYPSSAYPNNVTISFGPKFVPGAVALRYCFEILEVENGELLRFRTSEGVLAGTVKGANTAATADPGDGGQADTADAWFSKAPTGALAGGNRCGPWVYDDGIILEYKTDGSNRDGQILVSRLEVMYRDQASPTIAQKPTIYMLDIKKFNDDATGPKPYTASPGDAGVVMRMMKACPGGPSDTCIDATVTGAEGLQHMICPISGPVSVYTVGGYARQLYWMDLCGQMFAAKQTSTSENTWNVRRILSLNHKKGSGNLSVPLDLATTAAVDRKASYLRKSFSRLSIAPATCTGARSVAVYFGSGNIQRFRSVEELDGTHELNSARDVIGAIYDDGTISDLTVEGHLENVTAATKASDYATTGKKGWYIELSQDEKQARAPLAFLGKVYYSTYKTYAKKDFTNPASPVITTPVTADPSFDPSDSSSECTALIGLNRNYVVDACDAEAEVAGDRKVEEHQGPPGTSAPVILTPKVGSPIVNPPGLTSSVKVNKPTTQALDVLPILNWREPRIRK